MKSINFGEIFFSNFNASELAEKENIILFPAGKASKTFLNLNPDINVAFLCDNNPKLLGQMIRDIEIISLYQLKTKDIYCTIILTSPHLMAALIKQLQEYEVLDKCELILYPTYPNIVKNLYDEFIFDNRRKRTEKMLIVLAGHKPLLWELSFKRIKRFAPTDIDICIVTPGKNDSKIRMICEDNNWSYLSTATNNCCLAQNIAIELFCDAQWIYKLDEDIFICEGFFKELYDTYIEATKSPYKVGLVAPLIPVTPHGNVLFMKKFGLLDEYERKFGKAYYEFATHFEYNTDETIFLWEHTLPLDKTAKKLKNSEKSFFVAPHRAGIAAILFRREIWEEMGMFTVTDGIGMGRDEFDIAVHFLARANFYSYIIAENVLAGHYCFGQMKNKKLLDELYQKRYDEFDIQEV